MTKHTERLQRYLDRLGRARQHDHEHIHGFDAGEPTEALLLASDIQAAINQVKELETQPTVEPVAWRWSESGGERWFGWTTDWAHHDRAEKLGYQIEYAYAAPTTKAEPAPKGSGKWLTIVYRDIEPGNEAKLLGDHPKVSAMSWSHAMDDRDAALAKLKAAPADALEAETPFLQETDQHLLHRFIETSEDDESYDISKDDVKRLANLGVLESCGFGRYGVTMFGYWAHERFWHQNPSLPLKTNTDRDLEKRAAIAAQSAQGG